MDYLALRESELLVSRLGFGCCAMGGHGWGKVSYNELKKAVSVALDKGVNFFDTADIYGLGESEKRLGKFLGRRRHEAVITTKVGVRINNNGKTFYDNSHGWINQALDDSLKRLNTDYIDLYQVHYLDGITPLNDIIEVLERKRVEGKIRFYGLSNISLKDISGCNIPKEMLTFQLEYSLANRSNETNILNIARECGLEFMSWGSLGQGVLTGKYDLDTIFREDDRRRRPEYVNFHGDQFKKNLLIVEEMKRIASDISRTLPQIAIRWIIDYLGFGIVLVGIKSPKQIEENAGAFGWRLSRDHIDALGSCSIGIQGEK